MRPKDFVTLVACVSAISLFITGIMLNTSQLLIPGWFMVGLEWYNAIRGN